MMWLVDFYAPLLFEKIVPLVLGGGESASRVCPICLNRQQLLIELPVILLLALCTGVSTLGRRTRKILLNGFSLVPFLLRSPLWGYEFEGVFPAGVRPY